MTFEEWFNKHAESNEDWNCYDDYKEVWNAAIEKNIIDFIREVYNLYKGGDRNIKVEEYFAGYDEAIHDVLELIETYFPIKLKVTALGMEAEIVPS